MSMLIRENVTDDERDLLSACFTGMPEGSHLKAWLEWLMHEIDTHAACVSIATPARGAAVVLIQRRIIECPHEHG